ncbi:hypothetical protein [Methylomarinum vadi]|uniref:hypothetical protein n=1 Tax=Methylomarinum vadi TaxID=438855 RepID=UPI0004DF77FF|nr:hypothetical protein [Methylomarinum vadi]
MPLDILLTVLVTAMIQSLFGVGVLLFGTPALLLLGYDFVNALSVLLPISLAINALQILKHYRYIDIDFFKNVLLYTIPLVVWFLFIATSNKVNIGLLVGTFLLFVALKSFVPAVERLLQTLVKYEKAYLAAMGLVHGLTNLGGALLTAIVHGKGYDKHTTRVTVAICYATFAVFQLATLLVLGSEFELTYSQHATFLQIGVIVFLLTEELVYSGIDNNKYSKFFAAFLLASGVLLITKSL